MQSRLALLPCLVALVLPFSCGGENTSCEDLGGAGPSTGGAASGGGTTSAGGTASGGQSSGGIPGAGGLPPVTGGGPGTGGFGGYGGLGGESGDGPLFSPEGLTYSEISNGCGDLEMTSFTLQETEDGPEFFAMLRNEGSMPACDAALTVEFVTDSQQPLGSTIAGLRSQWLYLYEFNVDLTYVISCVAPGEVAIAHLTGLPPGLVVDDVARLNYRCAFFNFQVTPFDSVTVSEVDTITTSEGSAFTGSLENELELPLSSASVTVFTLTDAGRPFDVAESSAPSDILAGATWDFETGAVDDPGSSQMAFPYFANPF